jgi:cytochrome P450
VTLEKQKGHATMTKPDTAERFPATTLLDPNVIDDPYHFYRQLIAEAPVWRIPGTTIVAVNSFAAVTEAAARTDDFSSNLRGVLYTTSTGEPAVFPFDSGGMDALATADPPMHTRHRSAVFPKLVARRMAELRPDVEDLAHPRVDQAATARHVELMDTVANAVPIRVVSRLIGWEDEDPDALLAAAFDSTAVVGATETEEGVVARMVRTAEIMEWIVEQLDDAIDNGSDGILGALVTAIASDQLSNDEAIVILHTMLSAGGESTTSLIGNAIHLLANDRQLQEQLRGSPELVTPFIEEVLRLESPFRYHLRHAPADCELHGVEIPAGSTVLLMWAVANRDPAEYDQPDTVVLDRPSPRHHLGFGRGIHLCVGAPLARLETEVILTRLLERTTAFTIDPDDAPARVNSLMVRRFERLPLLTTPRERRGATRGPLPQAHSM